MSDTRTPAPLQLHGRGRGVNVRVLPDRLHTYHQGILPSSGVGGYGCWCVDQCATQGLSCSARVDIELDIPLLWALGLALPVVNL